MVSAIGYSPLDLGFSIQSYQEGDWSHTCTACRQCLFKSYRVFRGAECPANTDHYLVPAEVALFPYRYWVKPSHVRKYDIQRLTSDKPLQQAYSVAVQNRFSSLGSLPDDLEECWTLICSAVHSSVKKVVGYRRVKRKAWLSDASYDILQEKCTAKLQGLYT